MGHQFAEIAFTNKVKQVQAEKNSRESYASMEQGDNYNHLLSEREVAFIAKRDSFYMASVSETGWPYVQHRGGPKGFMRVLDAKTLAFADFSGNRQYISTGNFRTNNRVALIFMDYPNRTRIKVLGRVSVIADDDWETLALLEDANYRARVERGFKIEIEAFDWNCPQHITPRYTNEDIQQLLQPLKTENQRLRSNSTELPVSIGEGPLELVISGIRQLTPRIRAFELRSMDGAKLPAIKAGAHLEVPILLNGSLSHRHYSICSNPNRRDAYEIAVLSENDSSTSGSYWIHQNYQLGLRLRCAKPANFFKVHTDKRPALLIAGGIGITPIKSIAQSLSYRNIKFDIHYGAKSTNQMAFRDRLEREYGSSLRIYDSSKKQRMDIESLISNAKPNTVFYVCGPNPMIEAVTSATEKLGVGTERLRLERFVARKSSNKKPVNLVLARSQKTIHVKSKDSLLDAMLEAGANVPFSCKTGSCKSCAVKVLEGKPVHEDNALSDEERNEQNLMCPCVSRTESESITLDI